MPSKSPKQARFMAMCAHCGKGKCPSSCPSRKVSKEFNRADAGTGILKVTHALMRRKASRG